MMMIGTDSKERGDSSISFERKTSLFSLALSEILLINMWVHDIGRLQASNLSLLKVVLELNLQLFQKRKYAKILLLFHLIIGFLILFKDLRKLCCYLY